MVAAVLSFDVRTDSTAPVSTVPAGAAGSCRRMNDSIVPLVPRADSWFDEPYRVVGAACATIASSVGVRVTSTACDGGWMVTDADDGSLTLPAASCAVTL